MAPEQAKELEFHIPEQLSKIIVGGLEASPLLLIELKDIRPELRVNVPLLLNEISAYCLRELPVQFSTYGVFDCELVRSPIFDDQNPDLISERDVEQLCAPAKDWFGIAKTMRRAVVNAKLLMTLLIDYLPFFMPLINYLLLLLVIALD